MHVLLQCYKQILNAIWNAVHYEIWKIDRVCTLHIYIINNGDWLKYLNFRIKISCRRNTSIQIWHRRSIQFLYFEFLKNLYA